VQASPGKSQNEQPQGHGAVAALLPVWRTIQFQAETGPPWPEYRDIHAQKTAMGTNGPDISRRHIVRRNPDRGPESHSNSRAAPMSSFDYNAPADLFPARSRTGHRPVGYRRFNTAAEAIRFAIEQMPSEFLDGTVMESGDERADGFRIKALYDSKDYPLLRK
jgi:hypothetical protein